MARRERLPIGGGENPRALKQLEEAVGTIEPLMDMGRKRIINLLREQVNLKVAEIMRAEGFKLDIKNISELSIWGFIKWRKAKRQGGENK